MARDWGVGLTWFLAIGFGLVAAIVADSNPKHN